MAGDHFQALKAASARIVAGGATGTGYLVDPNRVVTCAHVVKRRVKAARLRLCSLASA
jgi:V8-like Glu-specific endopeptidase